MWKLRVNCRCRVKGGRVEASSDGGMGKRKFSMGNLVIDMGSK